MKKGAPLTVSKPVNKTKSAKSVIAAIKAKPIKLYGELCCDPKTGEVTHFEHSDYNSKTDKMERVKIPLKSKPTKK